MSGIENTKLSLQIKKDAAFSTCYVDPGPFTKPGQGSNLVKRGATGATGPQGTGATGATGVIGATGLLPQVIQQGPVTFTAVPARNSAVLQFGTATQTNALTWGAPLKVSCYLFLENHSGPPRGYA